MVRVMVRNLAGAALLVELKPEATGLDLKHEIRSFWDVPLECQSLVAGAGVLAEDTPVAPRGGEDAELQVTMVVTCEGPLRRLEDSSAAVQLDAIETLQHWAPIGDERASEALARLARGDRNARVRLAAVRALARVAASGCREAIAATGSRLADRNAHVRQAAAEALAGMAPRGDRHMSGVVDTHLRDSRADVRISALRVLPLIALHGDLTAVTPKLKDPDSGVRQAALEALGKLAEQGDVCALATACEILVGDSQVLVRATSAETLMAIAARGDRSVVEAACLALEDSEARVRNAAVKLLCRVAEHGEPIAFEQIAARLEHDRDEVRLVALVALAQLGREGSSEAIAAAAACLHCESARVLVQLARKADQTSPSWEGEEDASAAPRPPVAVRILVAAGRESDEVSPVVARAAAAAPRSPAGNAASASEAGRHWRVVGGSLQGGILAREACALDSPRLEQRLATGCLVKELQLSGGRLHFARVSGYGPDAGWVSLRCGQHELLVPAEPPEDAADADHGDLACPSGHALRPLAASTRGAVACDLRGRPQPIHSPMLGCHSCDYDVCAACAGRQELRM